MKTTLKIKKFLSGTEHLLALVAYCKQKKGNETFPQWMEKHGYVRHTITNRWMK